MSQVGYLMIPPEAWNAPPYLLWKIWPHYTQLSRVREFQCKYDQRKQDNILLATRGGPGNHCHNNESVFVRYRYTIAHCKNLRRLGESIAVFCLFQKLSYSNERSTKFESLRQEIEVFRGGRWQNDSSSNIT